ncbi:protein kinase (plasmid) [Rhodococcus pseudokoreensis]|uniref:Serine/threonine-protein kinase PknK n=1 Tax=Rhodococcus pseudokoreensis TaxID=2811421 RepID=A0A974VYA7_9NOCA|nr:serine/threonine-protein kinase [Rhodococcus pseudokoreensis]QSE87838.1 protein kinase [Rhodococcus pseudokoreensis]
MAADDPTATGDDRVGALIVELRDAGLHDAQAIGSGGFGAVFRCRQPRLDRVVAVKVLTTTLDAVTRERFLREQRAMGRVSGHPHIVNVFQAGVLASGRPFIVLQYLGHDSLDGRIRAHGPLPWAEVVALGVKMAGALETSHRAGTLHRDVTPANILLTEYGEPQLTDFGVAHITGGFETTTGVIAGSPAYTAPEVLSGAPASPESDVYGLGATLFCALTGHAAFERRGGEHLLAQLARTTTDPLPDLHGHDIPGDVRDCIECAMARDGSMRPPTAAAFGELLRRTQSRHGLPVDDMALAVDPDDPHVTRGSTGGDATSPYRAYRRANTTPPPAPATRFRPPRAVRPMVERSRLIDLLRTSGRRRLTVIHGPAGFGKSTLAAQWGEFLTESGTSVAWLTVDHDDNNLVWFLSHVIEALRKTRPTLARELRETLEHYGADAEQYVLTELVNQIHADGESIVLIVDDWHRITAPSTVAAMEFLLDHGCHHLQTVITSRTQSGIPASRMRVRDELVEIDSTALRFDEEEARALLRDVSGLPLDDDAVIDLTNATEGWVAALHLATLSLRDCDEPAELIAHLSGRHRTIGDYLAQNVLDALHPDLLEFMLATSVPTRISGDLAAELTQTRPGRAQLMLEDIERRDLFLRRLDDEGRWFHYHHLFAEFLQQRLERDHPGRLGRLHAVAAQWFGDHRSLHEAINHFLAAGDPESAAEIIEVDGVELLEDSQIATLRGLVEKLPPAMVDTRPRLQLALAWANSLLHRPAEMRRALDRAETALTDSSLTESQIADLRTEAVVVTGVAEIRADRIEGLDELVAVCQTRPDTLRPWVASVAANVATFGAIYHFDFDAARRFQQWAQPYHERNRGPYNAVHGLCCLGLTDYEQLDLDSAEDNFRRALRVARRAGGIHSHPARLAGSLLGQLRYERGDIAEAERFLDEGYELGAEAGIVDFKLARYVTGGLIKALRGDRDEALRRLREGARIARSMELGRLQAAVEQEMVRLGLVDAPVVAAAPPWPRPPLDGIEAITAQIGDATLIRALLRSAATADQVELACRWARQWVDDLEGQARPRALLHAQRLYVAALVRAGRTADAKQLCTVIAATCMPLGMVRFLPDGGPAVADLVTELRGDLTAGRWSPLWSPVTQTFLDAMAEVESAYLL